MSRFVKLFPTPRAKSKHNLSDSDVWLIMLHFFVKDWMVAWIDGVGVQPIILIFWT